MGANLSITQNSYEDVTNQLTQISNEECINFCSDSSNFTIVLDGGEYGNITADSICVINSASCNLKAALDGTLINSLSNRQKGDIEDQGGLFALLGALADIGSADDINQNNYQNIMNEATQQLNSICQTSDANNNNYSFIAKNAKVRNVNLTSKANISKSQCIIDNMSKFYASNNESNDQSATISKTGMFLLILIILLLVIIVIYGAKHNQRKKSAEEKLLEE